METLEANTNQETTRIPADGRILRTLPVEERFNVSLSLREPQPFFVRLDREVIHTATRRIKPEAMLLASSPIAVAIVALVGMVIQLGLPKPAYSEMLAAAIISTIGGMIASLPLFQTIRLGETEKMVKSAMASIMLRPAILLAGTFVALGPAWGLSVATLAVWMLAFYFPIMLAETTAIAFILRKLDTI